MDVGCMSIEDVKKYIEMVYRIKPTKVEKVWTQANFRESFSSSGSLKFFPSNSFWGTNDPTNADMADVFYLGNFEYRWYMYSNPSGTDYTMYLIQWMVTEFDFPGDTYTNDFQNVFRYDTDQAPATSFGSPWPTTKRNEVQYATKSDIPSFGLHTGLQLYHQVTASTFYINFQIFWKGFRIYFR